LDVTGWAEGERREGQVCREVYLSKEVVVEEKDASEAACVGAVQGVERGRAAVGAARETRRKRLGEGAERPAGKGAEGGSGGGRKRLGAGENRVEGKERKRLKSVSAHEVVNYRAYEEEDTCI
jgi:hypothetical protein